MSGGKIYSMHKEPVLITATIQIGATGAVSSFVGSAVQSVTRLSTGLYKITFQSQTNFTRLYAAHGTMQSPGSGLSGINVIEVQNAPNTSVAVNATPSITVKTIGATSAGDTTPVLKDPASGSALNVMVILSNSSITIGGE